MNLKNIVKLKIKLTFMIWINLKLDVTVAKNMVIIIINKYQNYNKNIFN